MCAYVYTSVCMHAYKCVYAGILPSSQLAQLYRPEEPLGPSTQPWSKLEKLCQPGGALTVQGSQPEASQ